MYPRAIVFSGQCSIVTFNLVYKTRLIFNMREVSEEALRLPYITEFYAYILPGFLYL